jgi:ABC-type uncharacterized transport system permease subunit
MNMRIESRMKKCKLKNINIKVNMKDDKKNRFENKIDNINEILPAFRRMWQVPRSIYIGLSSTIFTVLLPVGLVSSLPTEILLHMISWSWLSYFYGVSLITFLILRLFFQYSLKKYTSVGG